MEISEVVMTVSKDKCFTIYDLFTAYEAGVRVGYTNDIEFCNALYDYYSFDSWYRNKYEDPNAVA